MSCVIIFANYHFSIFGVFTNFWIFKLELHWAVVFVKIGEKILGLFYQLVTENMRKMFYHESLPHVLSHTGSSKATIDLKSDGIHSQYVLTHKNQVSGNNFQMLSL